MIMRKGWHCQWVRISFGRLPEHKVVLHDEIFTLCYYSNGGFTHGEVYDMPVQLRQFYLRKLTTTKQQEAEQHEKSNKGTPPSGPKIDRPGIKR